MAMARSWLWSVLLVACFERTGASGATFTFANSCAFTVWVGLQPNGGIPLLAGGGFELGAGSQNAISAPAAWGGRFWGRTGCQFDSAGMGSCATGDCGGVLQCAGAGGDPPATLAEITLDGANGNDYYDTSLVDGYNLPLAMTPSNSSCGAPACSADLNLNCPSVLQVVADGAVIGCRSACEAFNTPQYCCTGAYASPTTCQATQYSSAFKSACPTAYSYAYDDATSTFTCKGANYLITFCPAGVPVTEPAYNNSFGGIPPPPGPSSTPPPPSPPSPNSISQYGTGTGAGVRLTAPVGYVLLLCIGVYLFSYVR